MMELVTVANYATIKQTQQEVLLNIKGQYMRESNILAGNATIKQQQREVLQRTKKQYMKELNTLANSAGNN